MATSSQTAVIVDAVRTPLAKGKPGGAYAEIHPVDLHSTARISLISQFLPIM